jgi:hypothetical protein
MRRAEERIWRILVEATGRSGWPLREADDNPTNVGFHSKAPLALASNHNSKPL